MDYNLRIMVDNSDARARRRLVLLPISLLTIPCYCVGFIAVALRPSPSSLTPTVTPTTTLTLTSTLTPTPPTLTETATNTFTPTFTPSTTPSPTLTATLFQPATLTPSLTL